MYKKETLKLKLAKECSLFIKISVIKNSLKQSWQWIKSWKSKQIIIESDFWDLVITESIGNTIKYHMALT